MEEYSLEKLLEVLIKALFLWMDKEHAAGIKLLRIIYRMGFGLSDIEKMECPQSEPRAPYIEHMREYWIEYGYTTETIEHGSIHIHLTPKGIAELDRVLVMQRDLLAERSQAMLPQQQQPEQPEQ